MSRAVVFNLAHPPPVIFLWRDELPSGYADVAMAARSQIRAAQLPAASESTACAFCRLSHHESLFHCPHCGRPQNFPNVIRYGRAPHVSAVQRRYESVRRAAKRRGTASEVRALEAIAEQTRAVMCRPFDLAYQLVRSEHAAYASFYELLRSGVRLPAQDRFVRQRVLADHELFATTYVAAIRFAALSADGRGPTNYGDVALELAESMIAHRSTVFETNSAVFFEKARKSGREPVALEGRCALWSDRAKLAVAKHASELQPGMDQPAILALLLRNADDPQDDEFLEVHICGPLTRRSLARVLVPKDTRHAKASLMRDLREQLESVDVELGSL